MRSFLTTLGIIIGITSVTVMMSFGDSVQQEMTSGIKNEANRVSVHKGAPWFLNEMKGGWDEMNMGGRNNNEKNLTIGDARAVAEEVTHLTLVVPVMQEYGDITSDKEKENGPIMGVGDEYFELEELKLESGRMFDNNDLLTREKVVVIGSETAKNLFPEKSPIGENVLISKKYFTVIGVLAPLEQRWNQNNRGAFVQLETAQERLFGKKEINEIRLLVDDPANIAQVKRELAFTLLKQHKIGDIQNIDFTINSMGEAMAEFEKMNQTMSMFLIGIGAISLLVGGIGVMNIMLVSVTERTREIGIRKAVGARKKDILYQFLTESVILSMIGGGIGIALTFSVILLLKSLLGGMLPTEMLRVSHDALITSILCSLSVGIFFGIYPASKAAKLKPIDALRFE